MVVSYSNNMFRFFYLFPLYVLILALATVVQGFSTNPDDEDNEDDADEKAAPASIILEDDEEVAVTTPITEQQQKVSAFLCAIAGVLSFLGSLYLLFAMTHRWVFTKYSNPRDRILMGMSSLDVLSSIAWIFGPMASPTDAISNQHWSFGNQTTCEAQGFGIQLGFGVPVYNSCLCIYYALTIVHGMEDDTIRKYIEVFFHVTSLGFAYGTAISGLILDMYHTKGSFCWIEPSPYKCQQSDSCDRGQHSKEFTWAVAGWPLIISFCLVLMAMSIICISQCRQVARQKRQQGSSTLTTSSPQAPTTSTTAATRLLKEVTIQASLFVVALFFTYIWGFTATCLRFVGINAPFWLRALNRFANPSQGFWNFLIFLRPTYQRLRREQQQQQQQSSDDGPATTGETVSSRFCDGGRFQAFWDALKKESIDFSPPKGRSRKSLHAIHKALRRRRRSRSSISNDSRSRKSSSNILSDDVIVLPDEKDSEGVVDMMGCSGRSEDITISFRNSGSEDITISLRNSEGDEN